MPDDLLVIIPTRGRPGALVGIMHAWCATGATADILFAIDDDDPWYDLYAASSRDIAMATTARVRFVVGPRLRLCGTLNHQALKAATEGYRYVAFMGDDHRPRTVGWDARLRECLSGGPGIAYGNDLLMGEQMPTAVAMTSDIVQTLGYMAPPALVHLCLDLVWLDWGRGMGRITYMDDLIIEHLHPAAGKAELDAGYEECNSPEQVSADAQAYYDYRDNGGLAADLEKLATLLYGDLPVRHIPSFDGRTT